MYIKLDGKSYICGCKPKSDEIIYNGLTLDFHVPVDGIIYLYSDDNFLIRMDNTKDYLRQEWNNGVLVLTNKKAPEPEPTPEHVQEEPTEEDDTASMLIDHEYRLTLLELGIYE